MKRFTAFMLMLVLSLATIVFGFAATNEVVGGGTASSGPSIIFSTITPGEAIGVQDVTTDDLLDKIDTKGNDIAMLVQRAVQVIAVVAFFVGLLMVVVGAIGSKRMLTAGFIVVVSAVVVGACAIYGREVYYYFVTWLTT